MDSHLRLSSRYELLFLSAHALGMACYSLWLSTWYATGIYSSAVNATIIPYLTNSYTANGTDLTSPTPHLTYCSCLSLLSHWLTGLYFNYIKLYSYELGIESPSF